MLDEALKAFLHFPTYCLTFHAGTSLVEMHYVIRLLSIYHEKQNSGSSPCPRLLVNVSPSLILNQEENTDFHVSIFFFFNIPFS